MKEKRSYQTLEFWLTVAAMLVSVVLFAVGENIADPENNAFLKVLATISAALSAMGYTGFRTWQKGIDAKKAVNLAAITNGGGDKPADPQ